MKGLIVALSLILLSSCASQVTDQGAVPSAALTDDDLPRTVAVLPFKNDTKEEWLTTGVRKAFYNHFSSKPYNDIELTIVDERTALLEKNTGKDLYQIAPKDICGAMDCDGIVYGKITDYTKIYAAVYSQLGIEAEVWLVNARTGKEVFRLRDSVRYHEGSVPTSALGAAMTMLTTALNLRDIQQIRMINELCFNLNEKMPAPVVTSAEQLPRIREVLTNVKEGPFRSGMVIKVGLEGDKGLVASFDVGNFRRTIPMKETKPGVYLGEYLVMPGDAAAAAPLIVYLKKPGGYENRWIDVTGTATLDTAPPPKVKGMKARAYHDRVDLTWDAVKETPDLKGYKVLRSELPLSGYSELAVTELNSYEDKTVKPGTPYYYRVIAFDTAGNESERNDAVRGTAVSKDSISLAADITRDLLLSGRYTAKGTVMIPRGVTVTVDAGTVVSFEEGAALVIKGKLAGDGEGISFESAGDKKWSGLIVDGGALVINGFKVRNAVTCMSIADGDVRAAQGTISGCDTAVRIRGTGATIISGTNISGNRTGIELLATNAVITGNNIFQNVEGVKASAFSGELRDNNIFDNDKNISSEPSMKLPPNYLGTLNVEETRTSGVEIEQLYDNRVPGGKVVTARYDQYARLSREDRRKKVDEMLADADRYFGNRNYGRSATLLEESLKILPTEQAYYTLAVCYQEMKEDNKAAELLKEGVTRFPKDPSLWRALGFINYEKGNEQEARKAFNEVLRLSPEDRQVRFIIERIGAGEKR